MFRHLKAMILSAALLADISPAMVTANPSGVRTPARAANAGTADAQQEQGGARLRATLPEYEGGSGAPGQTEPFIFSPDGQIVMVNSGSRTLRLYDTATGNLRRVLLGDRRNGIEAFVFGHDSRTAYTRDLMRRRVSVWDTATGEVRRSFDGRERAPLSARQLGFLFLQMKELPSPPLSPDGRILFTERTDGSVSLWELATGEERATLMHSDDNPSYAGNIARDVLSMYVPTGVRFMNVTFSPNNQRVVTTNGNREPKLWETATGRLIATLSGHNDGVYQALFSPNGRWVATRSQDGVVSVWDAETGTRKITVGGEAERLNRVALSPDGRTLAAVRHDHDVKLWDLQEGRERATLAGSKARLIGFSPDGRMIVTAGEDKRHAAMFWDASTGERRVALPPTEAATRAIIFSPDGRTVVTASERGVRLWDATGGELRATLGNGARWPVRFSPDGRLLVTRGAGDTALLWEIDSN